VAEREFHVLESLEVLAAALEDVRREQAPQTNTQLHVLPAERSAIERIPEPEQRLDLLKPRVVALGVVLGLQGDVARIERRESEPRRGGKLGIRDGCLPIGCELRVGDFAERSTAQ